MYNTWVNVNLNHVEWSYIMFPQKHIFLLTEDEVTDSLPFLFIFSFNFTPDFSRFTYFLLLFRA